MIWRRFTVFRTIRNSSRGTESQFLKRRFFSSQSSSENERKKNLAMYLVSTSVAFLALSFAAVPLYRMFCEKTGLGGTVARSDDDPAKREERVKKLAQLTDEEKQKKLIRVTFFSSVSHKMPWTFYPLQKSIDVYPGETALAFFRAKNKSDKAITGVATYNVTPYIAGVYFDKIQCFCFEEQRLLPGETIDMPVLFFVDPDFANDERMKNVNQLNLGYVFFPVEEEDVSKEELRVHEEAIRRNLQNAKAKEIS